MSESGTFNSTAWFGNKTVPSFSGVYDNPPASDGASDTITLKLTDGQDGATGTGKYTIRFHAPIPSNGWTRDPKSPIIHPLPTSGPSSPQFIGEWTMVGPYPNRGTENAITTFSISTSSASSASGTIGATEGVNLDAAVVKGAFQANESVTEGQTYTVTATQGTTVTTAPGYESYIFWGVGVEHRFGKCDVYAANGYQGAYDWELDVPQTFGNSLAVRFANLSQPIGPL